MNFKLFLSHSFWLFPFLSFILGYIFISFFYKNPTLKAPALIGQTLDKALITLSHYNLNIRILSQKDDNELKEGTIISQTPAPGQIIKQNQALYVVISQKPAHSIIPDLHQTSREQAQKILENELFLIKWYPISMQSEHEYCIAQFPVSGMVLHPDTTLMVYYAIPYEKPVIMPNFKLMPALEVNSFLALHDVHATIFHSPPPDATHQCQHCVIMDQRPLPGTLLMLHGAHATPIQLQVASST